MEPLKWTTVPWAQGSGIQIAPAPTNRINKIDGLRNVATVACAPPEARPWQMD
jgi:hypothetical protein